MERMLPPAGALQMIFTSAERRVKAEESNCVLSTGGGSGVKTGTEVFLGEVVAV